MNKQKYSLMKVVKVEDKDEIERPAKSIATMKSFLSKKKKDKNNG